MPAAATRRSACSARPRAVAAARPGGSDPRHRRLGRLSGRFGVSVPSGASVASGAVRSELDEGRCHRRRSAARLAPVAGRGCLGARTAGALDVAGSSGRSRSDVTTPMQAPTPMTTSANVDTAPRSVPDARPPLSESRHHAPPVGGPGRDRQPPRRGRARSGPDHPALLLVLARPRHRDRAARQVGEGGPSYESDGDILFLTVRVGRVNAWEAFAGWVDGDVDMVTEAGVLQGLTDEENRARQAAAMVGSKNTALVVAFERLGLPLDPRAAEPWSSSRPRPTPRPTASCRWPTRSSRSTARRSG